MVTAEYQQLQTEVDHLRISKCHSHILESTKLRYMYVCIITIIVGDSIDNFVERTLPKEECSQ